jgi:hypothetical protein
MCMCVGPHHHASPYVHVAARRRRHVPCPGQGLPSARRVEHGEAGSGIRAPVTWERAAGGLRERTRGAATRGAGCPCPCPCRAPAALRRPGRRARGEEEEQPRSSGRGSRQVQTGRRQLAIAKERNPFEISAFRQMEPLHHTSQLCGEWCRLSH